MQADIYKKLWSGVGNICVQKDVGELRQQGAASVKNNRFKICAFFTGVFFLVFVPYFQFAIIHMKIWTPNKAKVNKEECRCGCFDTVNRGSYEQPGNSKYKHVYFNVTRETFSIWTLTVVSVILFYESVRYLVQLVGKSRLRVSMFILFIVNFYPNYYSWWNYFSYYNEEFFVYFTHHAFFAVTEVVSTAFALSACDSRRDVSPWQIWPIIAINGMHIASAGADQFIEHVLMAQGKSFQVARDVALMVCDVLMIIIALLELALIARQRPGNCRSVCGKGHLIFTLAIVLGGTVMTRIL